MILDLILIGLTITLEPVPITAFILLLSAEKGINKGLVFILAWLASFVAVIALVLVATGNSPPKPHSGSGTAAISIKLAIGVGLIALGEYKRRRLGRPRQKPSWLSRTRSASAWTAAGLALIVQPSGLVAAGAATVVQAKLSSIGSYLALFLFCLLSTATLLAMELYATLAPAAAEARLGRVRSWLENHQDQGIVLLSLLIGLWLTSKSIYQLAQ